MALWEQSGTSNNWAEVGVNYARTGYVSNQTARSIAKSG